SQSYVSILICSVSSSQDGISGSEMDLIVRPGDNVTLYCDCKTSTGVDIVWYRNCSHKHQPPLVISSYQDSGKSLEEYFQNVPPRLTLLWNPSNNTYNLLIENITESDLGLYYCGTMETKVNIGQSVENQHFYSYGNVTTRLSLGKDNIFFKLYLTAPFSLFVKHLLFLVRRVNIKSVSGIISVVLNKYNSVSGPHPCCLPYWEYLWWVRTPVY
uniref:Ig-like domain-containing protein n=1 Tax=Esox lucius TaxID=8010 RepID=A0A6Q2YCR5_ESOLU